MVFIDYKELIIIGIVVLCILYILFQMFIYSPIKAHVFGYRLYKYTKIPSHGQLITQTMWHKTDEDALKEYKWYEFVDIVYPSKHERRIKPEPRSEA